MQTIKLHEFINHLMNSIAEQKIPLTADIVICQDNVMTFDLENIAFVYDDEYGEIRFVLNDDCECYEDN